MTHRIGLRAMSLTAAGILAVSLAACAPAGGGESQVLRVTLANHVWTDLIKEKIPEFEEQTGITVEVTQLGEDLLSDQYNVKLNAGSDEIDVMMFRPPQEARLFLQNGYLADLTENVESDAEWDWTDFQTGAREAVTIEDQVVAVPIGTESTVLYYRADLLEAAGLAVPTTLDELETAAATISEANPGVAGFVARTGRSAAVTTFSSYLYSFGGDFFSDDGAATLDTPEAVAAYEYYGGLINRYGPENVSTDMGWPEASAIFAQGQAAFYTDASSLYQTLALPENSTVSDVLGYAAFPAGPDGSRPNNVAAWALGINSASTKQDEAWSFIQWATSQENVLALQTEGMPGARTSVWENPEGTASFPPALTEAMATNAANGVGYDRPRVINVAQSREIVGDPLVVAITGGDVAAAAAEAQTQFQTFLDDEK